MNISSSTHNLYFHHNKFSSGAKEFVNQSKSIATKFFLSLSKYVADSTKNTLFVQNELYDGDLYFYHFRHFKKFEKVISGLVIIRLMLLLATAFIVSHFDEVLFTWNLTPIKRSFRFYLHNLPSQMKSNCDGLLSLAAFLHIW